MPLDKCFYDDMVNFIQITFQTIFKDKIEFNMKQVDFQQRGYFKIKYIYIPLQYDIIIENEGVEFVIDIYNSEGAKNTLFRIESFNNELSTDNIQDAILILHKVLLQDNLSFYIYREKKIYKKVGNEYKRVKDLKELMGS